MTIINKANRSNRNRKAIAGVKKHYATTPSITLDGISYAPADIEKALQDPIDAADATASAKAVFDRAVAADTAARARGDAVYKGLKTFVTGQFKTSPDTLADFGIALPQRHVPDTATTAGAIAKRAATREARHTMGSQQKKSVKGTVPAAVTSPPSTASPPAVTTPHVTTPTTPTAT